MPSLTELANRYGSDKGTEHRNAHNFARVYEALFEPLQERALTIVELGLLHHEDARWSEDPHKSYGSARGAGAPSLEMWRDYFPKARLIGFDIHDFSRVSLDRVTIVQGDSSDRDHLAHLVDAAGGAIDVVIDDASHASHHQQVALGFLFRHLAPDGMYIIEDLHWQPPHLEPPDAIKTVALLRRMEATGEVRSPFMTAEEAEYLKRNAGDVMLFDSMEVGTSPLYSRDALGIVSKQKLG